MLYFGNIILLGDIMKRLNLINWLIIIGVSIFSILFLFFGNHEQGIYKALIIISIIPVMLIPFIVRKLLKIKIDYGLEFIYLLFVFFAHFLGTILNFYDLLPMYDKAMHGLSGIVTASIAFILLTKSKYYNKQNLLMNILFIVCITLSIAVLWEFFEFISDNIFSKDAQKVLTTGVDDTMLDMIMAFIGSIIFTLIYGIKRKND